MILEWVKMIMIVYDNNNIDDSDGDDDDEVEEEEEEEEAGDDDGCDDEDIIVKWNLASIPKKTTGGRLNKKDGLTRYGDSHVKDKTS